MLQSTKFKNLVGMIVILAATLTIAGTKSVNALSGSDWKAGNIVSDSVQFNNNAMSATDIQNFLNAKMPSCDTNGSKSYSGGSQTRAQYAAANGKPAPPYVCVRNYYENTTTHANNLGGTIPPSALTAAQIIKQAADTHGINPKTLIVLLQKEQTLITDDWPWPNQYRSATGYGCPDTAPCDAEYYGFYNQVMNAARQFKLYANNPTSYRYRPYQNNTIQFNPIASCGSTNVYVENKATAGLYNYTPYQPNASALNNLYGTGDSCGAYGNRNFWRLFNDWFGSTVGQRAQYVSQSPYPTLREGQAATSYIMYRNTSDANWYDDTGAAMYNTTPVHLAVTNPINSESSFSWGWPNKSRPAVQFGAVYQSDGVTLSPDQHGAGPGQIVKFNFNITVPYGFAPGSYRTYFQPVLEGPGNWDLGGISWIDTNVTEKNYSAQFAGQSPYPSLRPGQVSSAFIQYKNTGNINWYDDTTAGGAGDSPIHLATTSAINRGSMFSWDWAAGNARPAVNFSHVYEANGTTLASNQHIVLPGQIARFTFNLTVPWTLGDGNYREYFQPVAEGARNWNMGGVAWLDVNVPKSIYSAQPVGQSPYPSLRAGEVSSSYIMYKNNGNINWYDSTSASAAGELPIHLAVTNPINSGSSFCWGWEGGQARPSLNFGAVYEANGVTLAGNQHVATPGQIIKFNFNITVPYNYAAGSYRLHLQPIHEGAPNWGMGGVSWVDVTVRP